MVQKQGKINSNILFVILANLIPIIGVLGFSWRISDVVLLYYFESIVVGLFNVLQMICLKADGCTHIFKIFFIPFFLVHYNIFIFGQGVFILVLIVIPDLSGQNLENANFEDTSSLFDYVNLLFNYFEEATNPASLIFYAYLAVVLLHLYQFVKEFWIKGERKGELGKIMFAPYGRVVVQQILVIGGAFLLMSFKTVYVFLFLLVILKTGLDIRNIRRKAKNLANKPQN